MKSILELGAGAAAGAAITALALLASGRGRPSAETPRPERPASVLAERAEIEKLKAECGELKAKAARASAADPEAEIRELQARIDALAGSPKPATTDRARIVLEAFLNMQKGGPPDMQEMLRMLDLIRQMDGSDVPYLAQRYRTETDLVAKGMAFTLVFYAGGAPASAFLKEWLKDPALTPEFREEYLFAAGGMVKGPGTGAQPGFKEFPVDAELMQTAMAMADSARAGDRSGSAFILGNAGTADATARLHRFAEHDADVRVRLSAVRALMVAGDRNSATLLSAMELPPPVDMSKLDFSNPEDLKKLQGAALREAVTLTLQELERRFPK